MSRSSDAVGLTALALAAVGGGAGALAQPTAPPPCAEPAGAERPAGDSCTPRPLPDSELVPDLAVLKTPAAPAAMVLGIVDGQIQRPTTPAGLAVSLAAGISGEGEQKPLDNFAIEVSPFWLFDHPRLTAGDIEATRPRTFWRNLSISIATARREEPAVMEGVPAVTHRQLALGARTSFWPGRPSRAAVVCERYLDDVARRTVELQAISETQFSDEWEREHPRPLPPSTPDPAQTAAFEVLLSAWAERKQAALKEWDAGQPSGTDDPLLVSCIDDVHQRAGLLIDGATAFSLDFPGADFGRLDEDGSEALTGWLTVAYVLDTVVNDERTRGFEWSLLATGRAQKEWVAGGPDHRRIDAGGRLALAWERYGVSTEGVYRRQLADSDGENLWRVAVTLDYRLSGGTWASATFGKDFGATADEDPVLAVANLQWNLGRDRGVEVQRPDTAVSP